ncbi:d-ala-d-ala carboxypeptidase : D-alanyl-D-alanine carboxypeptidase, serine-type, PBP4 family OS=Singulisphaera acidiphila (strain ATCC BAA-1392 / DSM 18658 / VKM B-2454 / MOB10) GN=Sinac_6651 PE=4 SV=1: Peptidase_S13 [Gemmata massiliana]|uniref:D-alanyl-D-alanine carboxypeptidase/D-alanyl-D-alanine-endopeptidase n=1 Tax=Gemmata massiliana TaxID=1210884 RepID=A0A6P2D2G7_9BACT|nr:D-alanyl-D-alanine carboxypeptidase/D-alanyl-D-alanine-endopeptidase [Gemmata massiliana]VTR93632.1 d-ala-d-ala carboxypeptidase : D-alanyl-D-alanine carboxypeptidase, serine-type, PBP4 family OS=Singulisphaera acidiphila (strain ATCC BAA-1392 / DSM 18658 / VKM B-2454 / MOB10) GN=Sinac_6651 PE=4 SV=1: Peptidase_S13 [Gemmata massiliana]
MIFASRSPTGKAVAVVRARSPLALVLLALVWIVPAAAAPPAALSEKLEAVIEAPDYKHASWGILVADAKTGATVYSRNPDATLAPASVTKLFSSAAALVALGPDQKQETHVYQRGLALKGTLRGDLILVASGDLMFGGRTTKDGKIVFKDKDHTYANGGFGDCEVTDTDPLAGLNDLAKQVKAAGITQIDGEVLIDDRLFARSRGTGSGPDSISPIVVNDNAIDVIVTPGEKEGDPAKVVMRPETSFYTLDASVGTGSEKSSANLHLLAVGPTQFAVRGKVPVGSKPHVRIYNVDEPTLFARALFIEALRRNGVQVQCAVLRPASNSLPAKSEYEKLRKVATFTSAPLKDTLRVTLKVSHNLYASTLPALLAASKGQSTVESGLKEQAKILKELGVDTSAVSFGGGAGGSPADHASARATVQVIQGMAKRPEWDAYKAALPVLGVDGTLSESVKEDSPARGKASAKTGTLIWYDNANERFLLKSKALAGTMTTKSGTELYFCIIVNNVPLPEGVTSSREGKVLGKLCEVLYEHGP